MDDNQESYEVYRSRNQGIFWSSITSGMNLGFEEADRIYEEEKKKHPSDWIKVVRIERTTVSQYLGNKKKGVVHK